jgi:hypothetical protein
MKPGRLAVVCVASILLGGCQPGPSPAASPVRPSPAASSAAASSPATAGSVAVILTEPPASFPSLFTLELDDLGPFIRPSDGPAGYDFALPAAGARDSDGGYVLFIVWFDQGNPDVRVTVSRSLDGRTWDVGTESLFADISVGHPDPGPIPAAAVQLDDGSWVLYGWASDDGEGTAFSSWRASAPEPEGPWTLDSPKVIVAGPAGSWDSEMAAIASVQQTADGFAGWFEGQPPGSEIRGDIGLVRSQDGLAWTKHDDPATTEARFVESDPVIPRGICGAGTRAAVFQPQVEHASDGYVAVFGGAAAARAAAFLFGAVSDDGVTWQCGTPDPILSAEYIPDSEGIHTIASLPLDDGRMAVIIESIRNGQSELWWATVEVAR